MKHYFIFNLLSFLFILSCKNNGKESLMNAPAYADAMTDTIDISERQLIRTARLSGKVKDVVKSSQQIEKLTSNLGGFITSTVLQRNTISHASKEISADSSIDVTVYDVTNTIKMRIPQDKLDSTMAIIVSIMEQLDESLIKVDDASLNLLSLYMDNQRMEKTANALGNATRKQGKRLNESIRGIEISGQWQEKADIAIIEKYAIDDKVNFSTLEVNIAQSPSAFIEKVANIPNVDQYGFNLGHRFSLAFLKSWDIIIELLLMLVQWWFPLSIGIIVYLMLRKRKYHFPRPYNAEA